MAKKVGILSLQGGFSKHFTALEQLGVEVFDVRKRFSVDQLDGLIIPGGESTVIEQLIERNDLRENLEAFAKEKSLFGTCAGLILLANFFRVLDVEVERNGYGRQIASFTDTVQIQLQNNSETPFEGVFIRAPKITSVGKDVKILAEYDQHPVLVRQGRHLGATFHPELTDDLTIHRYYVEMLNGA